MTDHGSEQGERRAAERIVSSVSRRLAVVRGVAIGEVVVQGLGEVARHVGADGVTLMRTGDDDTIEYLYSWFDPVVGALPMRADHKSSNYDWMKRRLTMRGAQVVEMREVVARVPSATPSPQELQRVALLAMFAGEHVAGVLCFYYRSNFVPTTNALAQFEVLGDIMLGAITRRDAELAQSSSEARYRTIVETSAEGIWMFDREWRVSFANARIATMLGTTVGELVGRPLLELSTDTPERLHEMMARREGGVAETYEAQYRRNDNVTIQVRVSATPMRDERGQFAGTLAMVTDITAQRKLEAELAAARRLEAIGQLAGGVAHDINNALTVILLHAARGERLLADGPAHASFSAILSSAHRASDVAHQLLAFAKREPTQPRPCDAGLLLDGLRPMIERLVGAQVEVELRLAADRWPVIADPTQLERVLINLAANARDAMPDGGRLGISVENRHVALATSAVPVGDYVAITVEDTGHGMPPEVVARLFEPFFTTKADRGGTGLGLASSYGLVQQLGGTIEVESIVGVGTKLVVLCPRSATEPSQSDRFPRVTIEPGRGDGKTVLLVEDLETLRETIARLLEEDGYRVLAASDGEEAQRLSVESPIDALVTDVVLPHVNGYRLASTLREQHPDLPVLYLSGYDRPQGLEAALAIPKTAFASKPFRGEVLLDTLARLLR